MRTLIVLHLALLGATAFAAEEGTLAFYLEAAATHNPGLQSAHHQWQAGQARAAGADALPDPQISYGYFVDEVETRIGPQEQKIGASQMLPGFGKRRLRREAATAGADVAHATLQARELDLAFEVTETFYEIWYLQRALEVTRENMELVQHLEEVAQARIRAGGAVSGAIRAQVELGKLDDRLRTLEASRIPLSARLNAAIGRPAYTPVPWPQDPPFHDPQSLDPQALATALPANPHLQRLVAIHTQQAAQAGLARKARSPDFMIGVDYIATGDALNPDLADSGKDPLIAKIGLTLPLWPGKNRARIAEAQALALGTEQALAQQNLALESQLTMALFQYEDAARKATLHRDTLLPQARQSLEIAEDAYQAGSADFLNLIDAERLLLEFQLNHERARADLEIGKARIDRLIGQSHQKESAP